MMRPGKPGVLLGGILLLADINAAGAQAQAAPPSKWTYSAKVTAVWVGGNSESSTFGLGSSLRRTGRLVDVNIEAGAIRTDASKKTHRAVGTPTSFRIEEEESSEKTAESYFVRARGDRKIGEGLLVFVGVDWLRNTFSGVESRFLMAAGTGVVLAQSETFRFKTDVGVTYTFQEDVVENPFTKSAFPGVRFSADLMRVLTATTKWESMLISDLNLDETDDLRVDFTNALSLAISTRLGLKPSLQLQWRNQPALREIDLFSSTQQPTSLKVTAPLEKLDTFFTLALVVTL
jgi:putative salt-induced outer membrane protein YdiY